MKQEIPLEEITLTYLPTLLQSEVAHETNYQFLGGLIVIFRKEGVGHAPFIKVCNVTFISHMLWNVLHSGQ